MTPLLNEIENKALNQLKERILALPELGAVEFKLFGSRARGEGNADSDIDILIIVDSQDWHVCDRIYAIETDIHLESGIELSGKVISRKDYHRNMEQGIPFIKNIAKDGISV